MEKMLYPFLIVALGAIEMGSLLVGHDAFAYRHDWNIPLFHQALVSMWHETDGLTIWNREQLGSPPYYPTLAPYLAVVSLLGSLHLGSGAIERLIMYATFELAGLGMFRLLKQLGCLPPACFSGAAFFMLTPFLFNQLCTGVLADSLAYAIMPWSAVLFYDAAYRAREGSAFWLRAGAAGAVAALTSFHPVYLALNVAVFAIFAIAVGAFRPLAIAVAALVCADAYFIVPLVPTAAVQGRAFLQSAPRRIVYDLSPSILETFRLTGFTGRFVESSMHRPLVRFPWMAGGFIIAAGAVGGLFVRRTRFGTTLGFALVAFAVIAAGTSLLGSAYYYVISHLPAGAAFRESYRFTAVTAVLEAIGVGVTLTYAVERFPIGARAITFVVIALAGLPFLGNRLASQIPRVNPPAIAETAYDRLASLPGTSRMLYLPLILPVTARDRNFLGIDPMISWPPRASFGNYLPWPFLRALASDMYHGDAQNLSAMLHTAGVQYVDRRYWLDDRFEDTAGPSGVAFDAGRFTDASATRNLQRNFTSAIVNSPQERVWSIDYHEQDRVLPIGRLGFVAGSFASAGLLASEHVVPAYVSQIDDPDLIARTLDRFPKVPIVIVDGDEDEIFRSLLPSRYVVQPGVFAPEVNANAGWGSLNGSWMSWWWYRDRYAQSHDDLALVGSHNFGKLTLPVVPASGPMHVLVKAYEGPENGSISVRAGRFVKLISTVAPVPSRDAVWFDLGASVTPFDTIDLRNVGGENAVAAVIAVPQTIYESTRARQRALLARATLQQIVSAGTPSASVEIYHGEKSALRVLCASPAARSFVQPVRLNGRQYRIGVARGAAEGRTIVPLSRGRYTVEFAGANAGVTGIAIEPAASPPIVNVASGLQRIAQFDMAGRTRGPSVVELNTSYSPGWQLSGALEHFRIDGFANGWIVGPDRAFRISYAPRVLAFAGRTCTIAIVVVLIAGFVRESRTRRRALAEPA